MEPNGEQMNLSSSLELLNFRQFWGRGEEREVSKKKKPTKNPLDFLLIGEYLSDEIKNLRDMTITDLQVDD
jgi:hypothetical protein